MYPYQAPADLLKNRTILITGASQGIGKALAIGCAKLGAKTILLGRSIDKLEAVVNIIKQKNLIDPVIIPFDLATAQDDDYQDLIKKLLSHTDHLDGLVNNASIAADLKPFDTLSNNEFNQVMHVNVNASFALTKYCLPLVKKSADASIIFTSSIVGRIGRELWSAYAASKFATEGLMQCIAKELANTSIRVNSINPGATRTAMRAKVYPQEEVTNNPEPHDILPVYFYLLGADSKGVTGQALDAQQPIK